MRKDYQYKATTERNTTGGSLKELNYVLSQHEEIKLETNHPGELSEPYILLSRDFSRNEIALVYHFKNN